MIHHSKNNTTVLSHREYKTLQFLLFVTIIYPILIIFAFAAILHTQHFNHNLLIVKDGLAKDHVDLLDHSKAIAAAYDLLQHNA